MRWTKKGLIFSADRNFDWMQTHASIPVPEMLNPEVMRIYFGTRDAAGLSHIGYVDVEAADPAKIITLSNEPVLPLGRPGTFDDRGVMPSWIINAGGHRLLYYIGWNQPTNVSYRLSLGLAIGQPTGGFIKYAEGPISDRSPKEPIFSTTPCVFLEDGKWKMWYTSCTDWQEVAGRPEPRYNIKYAESSDGIDWIKSGRICIDYDDFANAFARPSVLRTESGYEMFYSYRNISSYRTDPTQGYRLGYAVSKDGMIWVRRDSEVGIHLSDSGWDSDMIEYCFVYERDDEKVMLYNGNGFGKSGFGYAVLESSQ